MTEDQRQTTWRFIKHLNRLSSRGLLARGGISEAAHGAMKAVDPDKSHAEQEHAMVRVAMLIGEYEP